MANKSKSRRKNNISAKSTTRISAATGTQAGPTPEEIAKLRKDLDKVTAGFFAAYGDIYDYMLVCPPGPNPPPRLEATVLNLAVS